MVEGPTRIPYYSKYFFFFLYYSIGEIDAILRVIHVLVVSLFLKLFLILRSCLRSSGRATHRFAYECLIFNKHFIFDLNFSNARLSLEVSMLRDYFTTDNYAQ